MAFDPIRESNRGLRFKDGRPEVVHEPPDTRPDPSTVFVEGRANVTYWSEELQADWSVLSRLAAKFGLAAHSVAPRDDGKVRRAWSHVRVDLDVAYKYITSEPGLLFDDWAEKVWLKHDPRGANFVTRKAARRKALVALSRLYLDGRVVKRQDSEDGRMTLWPFGHPSIPPPLEATPKDDHERVARKLAQEIDAMNNPKKDI